MRSLLMPRCSARCWSQVIDDAAAHLSAVAEGNDADAIEEAIKNVDKQTQDFAARRMDNPIRVALKGQSVDEV